MKVLLVLALALFIGLLLVPSHFLGETPDHQHLSNELVSGVLLAIALLGLMMGIWATRRLSEELCFRSHAHTEALSLAQHDPLTGLPNRRCLLDVFPQMICDVGTEQARAVMMLDLDGFKPINDVYGHAFGDTLLRSLSDRLVEAAGEGGLVARMGGDEFAIVSPTFRRKTEVASYASRLLARINDHFEFQNRKVSISAGIGIATAPCNGNTIAELLRKADIALYRAKASGRSSYRFFEEDMDAAILHRSLLEQRLRLAITERRIRVHFQPIMNMKTGAIAGFEALARWSDSDLGDVPPDQFIPIAEDCGLISDLTIHLLQEACTVATTWPEPLYLSFNLSPVQLQDVELPMLVASILETRGFPAERLVLEITETSLIKNTDTARLILEQLTQSGVSIALDDFGVGHSSLSYLRDFPIKKVKIDKSFTNRLLTDRQSAAIIEAILVLSRGLDIDVVAEGVEETSVHDALTSSGCQSSQGYLYAEAVAAEETLSLLGAGDTAGRRLNRSTDAA
ncbi:EAL domain-containing protein [Rhodobacterales bacterium]|nr:EAL domain-containing protein [Rhodobacterales bacterium]